MRKKHRFHWTHPRAGRNEIIGWWLERNGRVLGRIWRYTARCRWRADWYRRGPNRWLWGFERIFEGWSILEAAQALELLALNGGRIR